MDHFSQTEWVDFVRDVVTAGRRISMQAHLDQKCSMCLTMVSTWAAIAEFARREVFYEPPASACRNAGSYFVLFSLTLKERAGARILRHVFDSFDVGALTGLRGSGFAPRQLMYNAESVVIDLQIEQKPGSDSLALSGQVIGTQPGAGLLKGIPVQLLSSGDVASETNTNRCGEFNFQFTPLDHLALLLTMKDAGVLLLLPEPLVAAP